MRLTLTPNRRLAIFLQKSSRSLTFSLQAWFEVLFEQLKAKAHSPLPAPTPSFSSSRKIVLAPLAPPASLAPPTLLTAYEEELIWEKIISTSKTGQNLLRIRPIVALAREAHALIAEYRISSDASDGRYLAQVSETEEGCHFLEWRAEYQRILEKNHWLDEAGLKNYLVNNIEHLFDSEYFETNPSQIDCIGFSEFTPEESYFFKNFQQKGVKIINQTLNKVPETLFRTVFETPEQELRQAILMSRDWLEQNPAANIGIVILDLEQRRHEVEDVMRSLLPVESYNIAAPVSLSKHPIIASAFLGLSLLLPHIPLENISRLLRSPFFVGGLQDHSLCAALNVALHNLKQSHFTLEELMAIFCSVLDDLEKIKIPIRAENFSHADNVSYVENLSHVEIVSKLKTKLSVTLQHLIALKPDLKGKKNTSDWVETIKSILNIIKWGKGGRPLNSEEMLVHAEWAPLLLAYQQLDKILNLHHFQQAVNHLEMLAQKKAYTPPAKKAKIHALGLLEAAGMPFDYLWCVNFSEKVWPRSPAPNPFIPLSLQRTLNLPRSSASRESNVAKQFTESLCQGAKNTVIFSYAAMIDDRPIRISPLLKHLPEQARERFLPLEKRETINRATAMETTEYTQSISSCDEALVKASSGAYELVCEQRAEPATKSQLEMRRVYTIPPLQPLKGSVRALTLQAQCPFKAFAELRLSASPLQKPPRSLTKSERGEIVHDVLYLFWKETKNQKNLMSLSEEALQNRLKHDIDSVISRWEKRFPKRLTPQYMLLERQRVLDLLLRFIDLEKLRSPFEVVALETESKCTFASLDFSLRIDRIDKLEEGSEMGEEESGAVGGEEGCKDAKTLLIDYKTGQTQVNLWLEDPPQEPQLPLYCVTREVEPDGIAFGVLRSNDIKYQGISKQELSMAGVKPLEDWNTVYEGWRQGLERLAEDFAEGVANVQPVAGKNTCRTCSLHALCRIR